jgi:hypothetical protein
LRASLYVSGGLVAASGAFWLAIHDRSLATLCMEVHASAAMALLVIVGAAAALHVPTGWREGRNRASGATLSVVLAVLLITALLLYYAGDDRLRGAASLVHWGLGLATVGVLALHVWLGALSARDR